MKIVNSLIHQNLILLCILASCGASVDPIGSSNTLDCDALSIALIEQKTDALVSLLDPELKNFTLLDQDNNACPHDNKLETFIDLLNTTCTQLDASIICCGCVETFPTISEISVELDSVGQKVRRVLDLRSPQNEGEPLTFDGIHL